MRFSVKKATVCAGLLFMFQAPVFAEQIGYVTGDSVNVRQFSSKTSAIVAKLALGDEVPVVGEEGDFYRVLYNNSEFYVFKDFLSVGVVTGRINANTVNVRKYPSTYHESLAQADYGEVYEVIGKSGEWVNILYESQSAFIHKDFIDVPLIDKVMSISVEVPIDVEVSLGLVSPAALKDEYHAVVSSVDGLKMREFPSTESNVVTALSFGTAVDIIADFGEWTQVSLEEATGYMSSQHLTVKPGSRPVVTSGGAAEPVTLQQRIVSYAKQFLGTPYVWGGQSLSKGVDCSGFTYSVFANFGITINRGSAYQYTNGKSIKKADLKVGDLVFFDTDRNGQISHVGIYMGGGQFIHSSSSKRTWGVVISSLGEPYYIQTYYGACRIF